MEGTLKFHFWNYKAGVGVPITTWGWMGVECRWYELRPWHNSKYSHQDLSNEGSKNLSVPSISLEVLVYLDSCCPNSSTEVRLRPSKVCSEIKPLELVILGPLLVILLPTTLVSFTKLRFWCSYWGVCWVWILIGSKAMT